MKAYKTKPLTWAFTALLSATLAACGQQRNANTDTTVESATASVMASVEPASASSKPNILLIVVDDMGYSDIGAFGGEISTPSLDSLAKEGLQLTNFHVLPTCSPTRSVLLSGTDNHQAGLGTMGEIVTPDMAGVAGYEGYLNFQVAALPELLKANGYRTYMAGKWHLGLTEETSPHARGFDETFTLLQGGGSHWSDKRPMAPPMHMVYRRNGEVVESLPDDFYSSDFYTDSILEWLERDKQSEQPFFAYLSFTAPHDPLHAPQAYIDKYKGKYDAGWDELREKRFKALQNIGVISEDALPFPRLPNVKAWESMTAEEKASAARNMEIYAAMIDYIDEQIARVTAQLKASGEYDNTLILFFSDNGANGSDGSVMPGMTDEFMASFDNSLDNRGLANSYVHTGAGWAQASMAPSRLMKAFPAEGGIKSPLLVKLPAALQQQANNAGTMNHSFFHVRDIMPTILELTGIDHPDEFNGRKVIDMQGRSVLDLWQGKTDKPYDGADQVGYEFVGFKAYIDGDWKVLNMPKPFGKGDWELINLKDDPAEMNDLSAQFPEKREALIAKWHRYKDTNGVLESSFKPPMQNNQAKNSH